MKDLRVFREYQVIIHSIEKIEYAHTGPISIFRAKLLFIDNTVLQVQEVAEEDNVLAYSYYWLRTDNTVIIGWDNAPHHKEIKSYPHHRHKGKSVEESQQHNLKDVLKYIQHILE